MITSELIASLDELLQAGTQASISLHERISRMVAENPQIQKYLGIIAAQQSVLTTIRQAQRTEQTIPQILSQARDVAKRLSDIAQLIGESTLANALLMRVQSINAQMKAAGVGTSWLTILGLGAGAAAVYYLWRHFRKKKALAVFEAPEPDLMRPRINGLKKSLGRLRSYGAPAPCRQLGRTKRRLGDGEKYEFEPESRLEGHRGSRRRRSK